MAIEFKALPMMALRSRPGEVLDEVAREGAAFLIERNGQQKACLVPISCFLPDIQTSRMTAELDRIIGSCRESRQWILPVHVIGLQSSAVLARESLQGAAVAAAQFDTQLTASGISVNFQGIAGPGRRQQGLGNNHTLAGGGEGDKAISPPGRPPKPLDPLLHFQLAVRMFTAGVVPVNFVPTQNRLFGRADDHTSVEGVAVAAVNELGVNRAVAGHLVLFARRLLGGRVKHAQQTKMDAAMSDAPLLESGALL